MRCRCTMRHSILCRLGYKSCCLSPPHKIGNEGCEGFGEAPACVKRQREIAAHYASSAAMQCDGLVNKRHGKTTAVDTKGQRRLHCQPFYCIEKFAKGGQHSQTTSSAGGSKRLSLCLSLFVRAKGGTRCAANDKTGTIHTDAVFHYFHRRRVRGAGDGLPPSR
mgnify:CR=1 FL=1